MNGWRLAAGFVPTHFSKKTVSIVHHQAERHWLILRRCRSPRNPTRFMRRSVVWWNHSDTPKVSKSLDSWSSNESTTCIYSYMIFCVHSLQHVSLHTCCLNDPPAGKSKLWPDPQDTRPCVLWCLPKNKMVLSSRRSNIIVSKGLFLPLCRWKVSLCASIVKLMQGRCMRISKLYQHHWKSNWHVWYATATWSPRRHKDVENGFKDWNSSGNSQWPCPIPQL